MKHWFISVTLLVVNLHCLKGAGKALDFCDETTCMNAGECLYDGSLETNQYSCYCQPEYPGFVGAVCEEAVDAYGCRDGYEYKVLDFQTRNEYKYDLRPKDSNGFIDSTKIFDAFYGSQAFSFVKNSQAITYESKVAKEDFYVLSIFTTVREVRMIKFHFKNKVQGNKRLVTIVQEKINKKNGEKADYTVSETSEIPRGGHKVRRLEVEYFATLGTNPDSGIPAEYFWVRDTKVHVCWPKSSK